MVAPFIAILFQWSIKATSCFTVFRFNLGFRFVVLVSNHRSFEDPRRRLKNGAVSFDPSILSGYDNPIASKPF